jgi:hypothetical protein
MPSIDLTSRPRRSSAVSVHLDSKMTEAVLESRGGTYRLNDTAFALWELCDGTTTVAEMVDAVSMLFAGSPEALQRDVRAALQHLLDAGLVTLPERPAHAS